MGGHPTFSTYIYLALKMNYNHFGDPLFIWHFFKVNIDFTDYFGLV